MKHYFLFLLVLTTALSSMDPHNTILWNFVNSITGKIADNRTFSRSALFYELLGIINTPDKSILNTHFNYLGRDTNFLIEAIKAKDQFAIQALLNYDITPVTVDQECPLLILALMNDLGEFVIEQLLWYGAEPILESPKINCSFDKSNIPAQTTELVKNYQQKTMIPRPKEHPFILRLPFSHDDSLLAQKLIVEYLTSFDIKTILTSQYLYETQVLLLKNIIKKDYITQKTKRAAYNNIAKQEAQLKIIDDREKIALRELKQDLESPDMLEMDLRQLHHHLSLLAHYV